MPLTVDEKSILATEEKLEVKFQPVWGESKSSTTTGAKRASTFHGHRKKEHERQNRLYSLVAFSVFSLLLFTHLPSYAQSGELVANNTASSILPEVKQQMVKLRSANLAERTLATSILGEMGKNAVPAIPLP